MAGKRRPRRPTAKGGAIGLAKKLALAPITHGELCGPPNLVEPAWDGHRVLAVRAGDEVRLASSDHRDWAKQFPSVVRALAKLPVGSVGIDGVICALDDRGAPSFDLLRALVAGARASAVLIAWDLLWLDDEDLRGLPLADRRARLTKLLDGTALTVSQPLEGTHLLPALAQLGIHAIVARPIDGSGPWHSSSKLDWARSLSPPPPLSNADKVLYPRDGIAKQEIAAYYRDVAPLLVPLMIDRPVVVQRWVDGIDELDWYQHRVPPRAPDYLRAAWVDDVRRIVIENHDALLWMTNQAGLTYHGFGSRLSTLAEPDWAMLDLDPGDRSTWWAETIEVALAIRRILELLDLPSVVKTSGQRGLHILVPLAPGHTFEQAESFGRGIAELLVKLMPDKVTIENEKDKRRGRLLLDHKQFVAKTLVLPYSLRAVDRAPVSTPIAWDEVSVALAPRDLTLRTLRARLDARGDLAAPLLAGTASLDRALAQLRSQ
jgi:DNA ligase D-like protein (predicted polymerase)